MPYLQLLQKYWKPLLMQKPTRRMMIAGGGGVGLFVVAALAYVFVMRQPEAAPSPAYEALVQIAADINAQTPQQIDNLTTLKKAVVEEGNSLVYVYELAVQKDNIDFGAFFKKVYESGQKHWCYSADTAILRGLQANIVYRYYDYTGAPVGDLMIKTEECSDDSALNGPI